MNGIEKITERINKDAQEEILRAKESLDAEIAALFAKTDEDIAAVKAETEKRAELSQKDAILRAEKTAETKRRDIILAEKNNLIEKAFDNACASFLTMEKEEYIGIFAPMIDEAAKDPSVKGKKTLIFSEKERFAKELLKKSSLNDAEVLQNGSFTGGFILKTDDVEISCTVEKLIESGKNSIRAKVYKALFESADA